MVGKLWKKPIGALCEQVRIIDTEDEHYNEIGLKFGFRISDNKAMVYFPVLKNSGTVKQYEWSQCERI